MPDPFFMPDPFASLDPFSNLGGGRRRTAAYPPLPEAQADSAIQSLTGTALSGLGYVGSELDKLFGGRAVRGVLGGKPRELLSLLPGSDVVGLTNEADTVSGADLLKNIGYDTSQGNWLERNLVGPAVEVGLDPSTYLGGIGALTRGAKGGLAAAKTAQGVTKGFLPSIRAGERTLIHGLTGPGVANVAQGALDLAGTAANKANVGVRKIPKVGGLLGTGIDAAGAAAEQARLVGRSLFDKPAGRVANATMQASNEFTKVPAQQAMMEAADLKRFDLRKQLAPIQKAGVPDEEIKRNLTRMVQGVPNPAPSMSNVVPAALHPIAQDIKDWFAPQQARTRSLGGRAADWEGMYGLDYMIGMANKPGNKGGVARGQLPFNTSNPSQIHKKDIFDLPGGYDQLEHDFIRNPLVSGEGRAARMSDKFAEYGVAPVQEKRAKRLVADRVFGTHMQGMGSSPEGIPLARETIADLKRRSGGLSKYLKNVSDEHINLPDQPAKPFFNPDVIGAAYERAKRSANTDSSLMAVANAIGRVGVQGGIGVPATDVAFKAGLQGEGGLESVLKQLGQNPDQIVAAANQVPLAPVDPVEALRTALKGFTVPERESDAITKYMNPWKLPSELQPIVGGIDKFNQTFRDWTYSLWPASWGRNAASGVWENALEGTLPTNPAYQDIAAIRRGEGIVTGLPGHGPLTPEAQAEDLMREMYGKRIAGNAQGQAGAVANVGVPRGPMEPAEGLGSILSGFPKAPIETGKKVNQAVEDMLRQSEYLDLRRKGFDAQTAADKVFANHFDYHDATPFENQVMKRLVPFYHFPSRNVPKQVKRAIQSPAKVEIPLRLGAGARDEEGYVPEYLQSGLAIPLGSGDDGTQTYLSQLGLPMEEAFSKLKVGSSLADTATKTGQGLLGLLGPLAKGPLEALSGKQFFTGRDMADLHVGNVESLGGMLDEDSARIVAQALLNSPGTRMVSTLNRLTDTRKHTPAGMAGLGLGLTTGAKITDVDTEKWRAVDARHRLEEMMKGSPGIRESVDYYPTQEAKAAHSLTPQQEYELRLYAAMKARAREAAKEKKRVGIQVGQ